MNSDTCVAPQRSVGAVIHQPAGSEARWIVETLDGRTIRLGAEVGKLYECLDGASSTAHRPVLQRLTEQGVPLAYVELTSRLPAAVREAGFVAVKVLAAGLQPLIFNEDESWAYVPSRIACTDEYLRPFQPLI